MNSASLCSPAGRDDNPIPTRFLAPLDCLKIPAQVTGLTLNYTAKTKCRKFETNIPRKGISGPQSQFPHSCFCERIIYSHHGSACSAGGNMQTDPGNIQIAQRHMNVEIEAEAALFPEKEYINGIAVAVYTKRHCFLQTLTMPVNLFNGLISNKC